MSTTGKYGHELVDKFVQYLNEMGFEPRNPDEVPEELRTENAEYDCYAWQIVRASPNPWVDDVIAHLPKKIPTAYLYLMQNYWFRNFEVGPIMFFGNTGQGIYYEFSKKVFADNGLYPTMHKNGFLQFGNPFESNYDPICFDMKREHRGDAPIVQLDHEEILIRERIRIVDEIAPSFSAFMQHAISEKLRVL